MYQTNPYILILDFNEFSRWKSNPSLKYSLTKHELDNFKCWYTDKLYMGIITKETDTQSDIIIGNELSKIQNGKYYMGSYTIHWSLDLTLHTVTINITNRPDLGTKIIDKKFPQAEFRVDEPWYRRFYAKISGNFTSGQLSLDGNVIILTGSPRPGERWYTRNYESVIITTW